MYRDYSLSEARAVVELSTSEMPMAEQSVGGNQ